MVPDDGDAVAKAAAAAESAPVPESKELAQGREMAIWEAKARENENEKENESGIREDEAEERARKVSEAAVRRYWAAEEQGRKAPRGTLFSFPFFSFFAFILLRRWGVSFFLSFFTSAWLVAS